MHLKKLLLSVILISFIFSSVTKAQEQKKLKYDIKNSFQVSVMPFSAFDPNPRYRLGVEYIIASKRSVSIDLGFGSTVINREYIDDNSVGNNYSLFEIRPEFKRYLNINNHIGFYVGGEVFYIDMKNKLKNDDYYDYDTDSNYSYDYADVCMKKYGFHIKGGFKATLINTIALEAYVGFGYRLRETQYTNQQGLVEDSYRYFFSDFNNYKNQGVSGNFSLALGIKIGIVLWSSK